jgi:hypothetical protein
LPEKEQKGELVARPLGGAEVADPIAHHLGDTNRLQRARFLQHLCHTSQPHAHPIATVMVVGGHTLNLAQEPRGGELLPDEN